MTRMLVIVAVVIATASYAAAQRWQDATADCIGTTAEWTNDVDLADLDGDGLVDILVANGSGYANPGASEATRIWRNLGGWDTAAVHCSEVSAATVLGLVGNSRTIKAADLDRDGDLEIITGGGFQTQLQLYARDGETWSDVSDRLPQQATSIGDVEVGDVDGDGDFDLLLAEWGAVAPGAPSYEGGRTRLYLNDGTGAFTDVTAERMPDLLVGWSWDVELVDVDQDWDLDALVSAKLSSTSYLFRNDGTGTFANDPDALPHFSNNYEFEAMDIDGDGDLDLATINDGGQRRDRIFVNDGTGRFTDETAMRLTGTANPTTDDNAVVFLDVDVDGDADLLVASLSGPDRLCLNDGTGRFTLAPGATPNDTPGSLALAVADLDGDGRLDILQGQGEGAFADKVQLATDLVAIDTGVPVVSSTERIGTTIYARVHDHQSPSRPHDWQRVWLEQGSQQIELQWYGGYLWRAEATPSGGDRVCARDRRGNEGCSTPAVTGDTTAMPEAGVDMPPGTQPGGCCDARGAPGTAFGAGALALLALLRRRRR